MKNVAEKILGMCLMEMTVVLMILGMLVLFCFPIYTTHVTKERRLEAEFNLMNLASALEQYQIRYNTYRNATLDLLGFSEKIISDQYQLVIVSQNDSSFVVKAVPINSQADNDPICASLVLNSAGKKAITGTGKFSDCWS